MHSSPSIRSTDNSAGGPAFRTYARSPCSHAPTTVWTRSFQYRSLPPPAA
eukprot:CAMPEP_0194329286 /NCGR_PEP_ID=MMETSP0171-20130528/47752_1 /TAXON_ID=218684 /ORGANISM="Corethron pennatum, Strain L29A3" /LENGTH=49 /DNA_ID= /DNA_START= /DNA_END= /DNA_ORIENTATION=